MWLFAKSAFGTEKYTAFELKHLGAKEIFTSPGGVYFRGNKSDMMRINYKIRTATRILWILDKFQWQGEKELYRKVKEIQWERLFHPTRSILIHHDTDRKYLKDSRMLSLISKDAICDRFREKKGLRPNIDKEKPDIRIFITINNNYCYISLDTSGDSLNMRGYRTKNHPAPLRETLAASLIFATGWNRRDVLIDPMCGSGTIPIEAALYYLNIPPQIIRKYFSFMNFNSFDVDLWNNIRTESVKQIIDFKKSPIFAGDISADFIKIAMEHAKSVGVENKIKWYVADFKDFKPPKSRGILLMNPPYNKRLKQDKINEFYSMLRDTLKRFYKGYRAFILTGDMGNYKKIHLKTASETNFYNGPIQVKLLKYLIKR
ncbi:hypothetical protein DRP44_02030 [candidate division TA06 bacterium]|jgi:putative N6-adenine-specific DNA methylase|uniref:THUMP domain-containing protein n=1 Tax=candidate division TA06 bacterium TaxID=2250710 RepID=A0A660SAD9_UNCT6|nr:MAG: hypothetical protein DRP44_02030 [candidate division TA06 bacterium]